jgi:hypothetical protein
VLQLEKTNEKEDNALSPAKIEDEMDGKEPATTIRQMVAVLMVSRRTIELKR